MTAVTLQTLPPGDAGTRRTLEKMAELARASLARPLVRAVAQRIVEGIGGRDYPAQLRAVRGWLVARWRFLKDPHRLELIQTPEHQLAMLAKAGRLVGDCDDVAVLSAALVEALGFPARYVVLGWFGRRGAFSHVYTEALSRGRWWEFDITRRRARPKLPATRIAVYPVE